MGMRRGGRTTVFGAQADVDGAMAILRRLIGAVGPEGASMVAYAWTQGGCEGYVAASVPQVEAATGLRRERQKTGLRAARDAGLLDDFLGGVPRRRHLRVDAEAVLRLVQCARKAQSAENPHARGTETRTLADRKPAGKRAANTKAHTLDDPVDDGLIVDRSGSTEESSKLEGGDLHRRIGGLPDDGVSARAIAVAAEVSVEMQASGLDIGEERTAKVVQVCIDVGRVEAMRQVITRMVRPNQASRIRNPYSYLLASIAAEPPETDLSREVRRAAEAVGGSSSVLVGYEHLERPVTRQRQEYPSAASPGVEKTVRAMIADPYGDIGRVARQVKAGRLPPSALHERISVEQTGGYDAAPKYAAAADEALEDLAEG